MQAEPRQKKPPLDGDGLQRLALRYVERFATTSAKLQDYLARKVRERGWEGEGEARAAIERLAERICDLGYIDDSLFAKSRSASLLRRGYGAQRVRMALRSAGVSDEDSADAREMAQDGAWAAALRFAARRRIGPYAAEMAGREAMQKAIMAMIRAGHAPETARKIVKMAPGSSLDEDESTFPLS